MQSLQGRRLGYENHQLQGLSDPVTGQLHSPALAVLWICGRKSGHAHPAACAERQSLLQGYKPVGQSLPGQDVQGFRDCNCLENPMTNLFWHRLLSSLALLGSQPLVGLSCCCCCILQSSGLPGHKCSCPASSHVALYLLSSTSSPGCYVLLSQQRLLSLSNHGSQGKARRGHLVYLGPCPYVLGPYFGKRTDVAMNTDSDHCYEPRQWGLTCHWLGISTDMYCSTVKGHQAG